MKPDVQSARDALAGSPDDRSLQLALARTLIDAAWFDSSRMPDHYSESASIYHSILTRDPEDVTALINLGVIQSDQGGHQGALTQYERAISLGADNSSLHYNIGVACVNLQQLERGRRHFQIATTKPNQSETIRAYFGPQAH